MWFWQKQLEGQGGEGKEERQREERGSPGGGLGLTPHRHAWGRWLSCCAMEGSPLLPLISGESAVLDSLVQMLSGNAGGATPHSKAREGRVKGRTAGRVGGML